MIYLSKWQWKTTPYPHWAPPDGAVGSVDLRSLPQCAQQVTADGYGLFDIPGVPPVGAVLVGADMEDRPSDSMKDAIALALGIQKVPAWTTCGALAWEILSLRPDVAGVSRWRNLMPKTNKKMELILGPWRMEKSFAIGVEEWPVVQQSLQLQYREAYQDTKSLRPPSQHHRKVLDYWCEKYRTTNWQLFVPGDLPKEEPVKHSTTITESFNKADSDTLGPDLSWTEFQGDIDIVSNRAKSTTGGGFALARADSDLSSADHYAQAIILREGGDYPGTMVRKDSSATVTFYLGRITTGADNHLVKLVGGSETKLGSSTAGESVSTDYTVKTTINGTTLTVHVDAGLVDSVTDTSIASGTRCGIGGFVQAAGQWEDFEAADLAAAGGSRIMFRGS